jgi:chorismate mutase
MTKDEALAALGKYRDEIDALDLRLLELLNARTRVVEKIGQIKESVHLPVYEPKREDAVFANVTSHNTGPLTPEALQRIFERIIDEMRSLQQMRRQGDEEC